MNVVHTISPGAAIPEGYFDYDNISFIQNKITEVLDREFLQHIVINRPDIITIMQYMLSQRHESIPKLNQRVIMYITNDFRNHQQDVNKHLKWEEGYSSSQKMIDHVGQISGFDNRSIKTTDTKKYNGKTTVGGTLRFHFT